ncbi:MAG: mobile mystery protein B [Jatrophihabitantaceae bacterium]
MNQLSEQPSGATPLTDDDLVGLRQTWITTQAELNMAEAENVLRGRIWAFRRRGAFWYLDTSHIRSLHRRMFADVWDWAGQLRLRETNIGVNFHDIGAYLHNLCEDVKAQVGSGATLAYPADELAVRFHHRLVAVHPFRNGNGRHSRLVTDLLVRNLDRPPFSWGGIDLASASDTRSDYLSALRTADRHNDFTDLLAFARR